jgi:hypothetical protein
MDILRRGNRGFKVEFLQRLLNKAARRESVGGTLLVVDGNFGPLTETALRAFQGRHRPLVVDGVAGNQTWNALGLRTEREHARVILFGQPTGTSCWSAAATMILGNQSVGPGGATIVVGGGLSGTMENLQAFARSLGWQMLNHSPGVQEMVNLVRRTSVWIKAGGSNWAHAVVLSGVYSDGDSSGDGTIFRIHDPWPPGRGRIYGSFANPIMMFGVDGVTRVPASLDFVLVPR